MTEAERLVKLNKRPSLPVSIPIHIYRKNLKKKSKYRSSSKPINISTNKMSTEKQTNKKCQTIRQTIDVIVNPIAESPANKTPLSERPAPERPVPRKQVPDRLESERPEPERPAPERPSPERPEREEFERRTGIKIQCCEHVCSIPYKYSLCSSANNIFNILSNYMNDKSRLYSDKCTQTDNIITIEDIDETLKASDPVLKDITTFSNQFKQFFAQLGTMCQVLFKVKTKDDKEVFVFSRKKRQLFLSIIKNLIETLCCDDTDMQPPINIVAIDVDEFELADITASEHITHKENTVLPKPMELAQPDKQQNQRQKESVNSVGVATCDNVGVMLREEIGNSEQTITNPTTQRDLQRFEQEVCDPTLMEESVNRNISINNEINIEQTTFIPQIMENTRRFRSTPRPQATRDPLFYQNENYRYYHNRIFRHPSRGNGRPSVYPQRRTLMRDTDRQLAMNTTQSPSAQIYCPYNQQRLQQQYMIQQYYQRNPDTRQNTFSDHN